MRTLFLYLLICSVCLGEELEDPFVIDRKEWAKEICTSNEYGPKRDFVLKWDHNPTVSIFNDGCSKAYNQFIKNTIYLLNHKLRNSGFQWKFVEDDCINADITIKNIKGTEFENFEGYCRLDHRDKKLITAEVFLNYEKDFIIIEHAVHEEIMHTTGILNDSCLNANSIFWAGYEITNVAKEDFELVEFFYKHFESGMDEKTAFEIIEKYF